MKKTFSCIALSLAFATAASAAETKTPAKPVTLSEIFAEVAVSNLEVVAGPHGFVIDKVTTPDVIVVRRNADGTRSSACVNNERAARAFLSGAGDKPVKAEKE